MNRFIELAVAMVLFLSAPAVLACEYPSRPADLPDGTTASQDEMFVGVKAINSYQVAMQAYLDCIEADKVVAEAGLDDADEEAKQKRNIMFNKKYNAAVDDMTFIVAEFNVQIRAYKQRSD